MTKETTTPRPSRQSRAERNNNPLNIRRTQTRWEGQVPDGEATDRQFCQFKTAAYGWRAAFILLTRTYYHVHHLSTISAIISRWAPPTDGNDTQAYISRVCQLTGYGPQDRLPIPSQSARHWISLACAMATVESGNEAIDYFAMFEGWDRAREYADRGGW